MSRDFAVTCSDGLVEGLSPAREGGILVAMVTPPPLPTCVPAQPWRLLLPPLALGVQEPYQHPGPGWAVQPDPERVEPPEGTHPTLPLPERRALIFIFKI